MEIWSGKDITPQTWQKVKALFEAASEMGPAQRAPFLAQSCPDERVRAEVERLLENHDKAGDFLVGPAVSDLTFTHIQHPSPSLVPGTLLADRFKIVRFIAQGGMGEVYEAEDLELHELLGIKTLRAEVLQQPYSLERFKREVYLARKVTHPNVCRIFDLFRAKLNNGEEVLFVTMEFLRGETLAHYMGQHGRMSVEESLPLITQMASGLGAAHRAGIVHRDFKPGNVVLVDEPTGLRVSITDFGLAFRQPHFSTETLSRASWEPITVKGELCGTPAYMSPEQIAGQPATAASDIYAFGLVIYEMLTGVRPFSGTTPISMAAKRLVESPPTPRKFEPALSPVWEAVILKCLERNPSNRFVDPQDISNALAQDVSNAGAGWQRNVRSLTKIVARRQLAIIVSVVVSVLAVAAIAFYWFTAKGHVQQGPQSLVIADFNNSTGDPSFDDGVKDAVVVQLQESPIFQVISQDAVTEILKRLGRPKDAELTNGLANDVCYQLGATALVRVSLARDGNSFVIAMNASSCDNGENIANEQLRATSKDQVLATIWKATANLRHGLGESLHSVTANNVAAKVTTSSIDAFESFQKGFQLHAKGDDAGAIPFLKQSIEIDPNFAYAYATLGICYSNTGATDISNEALRTAFSLREQTSAIEKIFIEAQYFHGVTGELFKEMESLRRWEALRPNGFPPHNLLALAYRELGDYGSAEREIREAVRVNPNSPLPYLNLGSILLENNRLSDLRKLLVDIHSKGLDDVSSAHALRFRLALVSSDEALLKNEEVWAQNTSDQMASMRMQLEQQVESGSRGAAQNSVSSAIKIAARLNMRDVAADALLYQAWAEVLWGYTREPLHTVDVALKSCKSSQCGGFAARILAMAGASERSRQLCNELAKAHPEDTLLNAVTLTLVKSVLEFRAGRERRAVQIQDPLRPFDFGSIAGVSAAYIRGLAFRQLGRPQQAVQEFRSILDHEGLAAVAPERVLAYLQLGRSYAALHDIEKSKEQYSRFFLLWKDADPDIPILKQARAEYFRLR